MAFRPALPGILASVNRVVFPTQYRLPTANSVIAANTYSWSNPTNVYADDESAMSTGVQTWSTGTSSDVIRFTGFGFTSAQVPSGSTIDGVEIEFSFRNSPTVTYNFNLFDATNGVSPSAETANSSTGGTFGVLTRGDATDLFGNVSISDADVRASTFGVQVFISPFTPPDTTNVEIDYIKLRIHGTEP